MPSLPHGECLALYPFEGCSHGSAPVAARGRPVRKARKIERFRSWAWWGPSEPRQARCREWHVGRVPAVARAKKLSFTKVGKIVRLSLQTA